MLDPEVIDRAIAEGIRRDIEAGETVITVICSPCDEPCHVPSMTAFCRVCSQPAWLSRRIAESAFNAEISIMCIPCWIARLAVSN